MRLIMILLELKRVRRLMKTQIELIHPMVMTKTMTSYDDDDER